MKVINLTIDYEPTPKGRPRVVFKNGAVRTYTPQRTVDAQEYINTYLSQFKDCYFPIHTAVKMTITFWRRKSIWLPKREKLPTRKPDLNNFLGLALDAINKKMWYDDCQVTTCLMKKRWSSKENGYIEIRLEEDSGE
jgi:Holliday junction resolvase RusA-like endonuclease